MSTYCTFLSSALVVCLGASGCGSAPPAVDAMPAVEDRQEVVADLDKMVAEAAVSFNKVERNGVLYFCKRERQIGSNISKLKCLTESQLRVEVETMAKIRDDMRNRMGKCTAGRAGQGGPCGGF
jgi:hypothetical protein